MAKDYASRGWSKSFFNGKQWKTVRQEILRRDRYTCCHCYARGEEVHHVISLTPDNINDNMVALNPDNLILLCTSCHTKITNGCVGDVVEGYCFDESGQVVGR